MPTPAAIRPYPPEPRGFGPFLDHELEEHIRDCEWQWQRAYARFQAHGCPHDRDEALQHLHRMNQAILARSPAVQAERHAAFERTVTERFAYFISEHAQQLGKRAIAA